MIADTCQVNRPRPRGEKKYLIPCDCGRLMSLGARCCYRCQDRDPALLALDLKLDAERAAGVADEPEEDQA